MGPTPGEDEVNLTANYYDTTRQDRPPLSSDLHTPDAEKRLVAQRGSSIAAGSPTSATENEEVELRPFSKNETLPFEGLQATSLMAIVRAYLSRTFAEELPLVENLTDKRDIKSICDILRSSPDFGTSDDDLQRHLREDILGTNVSTVRKPTRQSSHLKGPLVACCSVLVSRVDCIQRFHSSCSNGGWNCIAYLGTCLWRTQRDR